MTKFKFLQEGQKFNKLTVIRFDHFELKKYPSKNTKKKYYLCQCDCGNISIISHYDLTSGHTKSCGCLQRETTGNRSRTHGLTNTNRKLYSIWSSIKDRCSRPKCKDYVNYGGRGIKICDKWKNDFKTFHDWAKLHGYKEGLTIERINVNGNYTPRNCKWIENEFQSRNTRTNHYITYKGETKILCDWAREYNLCHAVLSGRLKLGWSVEQALTIPLKKRTKQ